MRGGEGGGVEKVRSGEIYRITQSGDSYVQFFFWGGGAVIIGPICLLPVYECRGNIRRYSNVVVFLMVNLNFVCDI